MKLIPWIIAGVSASVLIHILQSNQRQDIFANETETDDLSEWGLKQSVSGGLQEAGGSLERAASDLSGDDELGIEGIVDTIAGSIKVTAGRAAQVVQHEITSLER